MEHIDFKTIGREKGALDRSETTVAARRRYIEAMERTHMKSIYSKLDVNDSAGSLGTAGFYPEAPSGVKTKYYPGCLTDGYDFTCGSRNTDIPDAEFRRLDEDVYNCGEFVWTGFDYLGEPAPFNKDGRSSNFGIVALTGIPKDRYYLYRSR